MKSNWGKPISKKQCVSCKQPFTRKEIICWRCNTCQGCKQLNPDKNGNRCIHCHNYLKQSRNDQVVPELKVRHYRR